MPLPARKLQISSLLFRKGLNSAGLHACVSRMPVLRLRLSWCSLWGIVMSVVLCKGRNGD
jgi:hypothetical protein